MDVVYTFQTGQAAVPGALRRQPSVVSQHNDTTAAKTLSSPTPAASSSTAGSESVMEERVLAESFTALNSIPWTTLACMIHHPTAPVINRPLHVLN